MMIGATRSHKDIIGAKICNFIELRKRMRRVFFKICVKKRWERQRLIGERPVPDRGYTRLINTQPAPAVVGAATAEKACWYSSAERANSL